MQRDIARIKAAERLMHAVAADPGQPVPLVEQRHLHPQPGESLRQFGTQGPGADHRHAAGKILDLEHGVVGQHPGTKIAIRFRDHWR